MNLKYDDYVDIVAKFNTIYHSGIAKVELPLDYQEIRLIYLALVSAKANLKEYDPKKGLNQ
jgi:hypothetical protein